MSDNDFNLKGKKVLLRPFIEDDIDDRYVSWLNDPDVMQFSNQRFLSHNRNSCITYLRTFKNTDNLFINIFNQSNKASIGTMTAYISTQHQTADIGILIGDKSVWGSGYGKDAWNTLITWLFEYTDIRKITGGTLSCNVGMRKILEQSGMHHEATRKAQELVGNIEVDILYYAKFRDF